MVIAGRNEEGGQQAVEEIAVTGGRAGFLAADLTNAAATQELADRATGVLGGSVDILVTAGIFPFGPTAETDESTFDAGYALNVKAPTPHRRTGSGMAARGHGAIVNVTTMVAEFGAAGMALYGSTTAALALLTKSWAAEYGPSGSGSTP